MFKYSALGLMALLFAVSAHADEGRYQDYAIGARALGLGGAFTALADDGSGVFYNPAGIVDTDRAKLSISTSLYGLEFAGEQILEDAQSDLLEVSAADLIIIPSTTGYVAGIGKPLPSGAFQHAWAFGTQVPQYQSRFVEFSQDTDGTRTRFRSSTIDRTLHAGVAYAVRAGPWLRLGIGGHYVLRTLNTEETLTAIGPSGDTFFSSEARLRTSIHSLRVNGGLKWWPGPRWRVGVSVLSPTFSVLRDGNFRLTTIDGRSETPRANEAGPVELRNIEVFSVLPLTVRLGAAFVEPRDYTVSFDAVFYAPSNYELVPAGRIAGLEKIPTPLSIEREGIFNFAIGGERYLTSGFSISGGMFTNFSAAPRIDVDDEGFLTDTSSRLSNISMVGASLSIGLHTENVDSRLGVTGSVGYGLGVKPSPVEDRFAEQLGPPLIARNEGQAFVYVFWSSSFRHGVGGSRRRYAL